MSVPSFWGPVVHASISVAIIRLFTVLLSLQITETSSNHINIKRAKSRAFHKQQKKHSIWSEEVMWPFQFTLRFSRKCIELRLTLNWRLDCHLKSSSRITGNVNSPWVRKTRRSAKNILFNYLSQKDLQKNIFCISSTARTLQRGSNNMDSVFNLRQLIARHMRCVSLMHIN